MKLVEESYLATGEYHVESLFAIDQHWDDRAVFVMRQPRLTSALLYVNACTLDYTLPDGSRLQAQTGDVVYLPQGSRYETRFLGCSRQIPGTLLVEFVPFLDTPFVWADTVQVQQACSGMKADFEEMIRLSHAPLPSPAGMRAVLYRMLEGIGQRARRQRTSAFAAIAPGIDYLENDPEQRLSIAQIAQLCHVSPSCLRRLFKQYAGVPPVQFQLEVKLRRAKRLLSLGSMTVCEVADALGFADPSYFCRIFRKHTGTSPAAYAARFANPPPNMLK